MLTAIAFLIGSALLGIGVINRAAPLRGLLNHAERLLWGLVTGWMLTTLGAYFIARLVGRLSFKPILIFVFVIWTGALLLSLGPLRRIWRAGLRGRRLWRPEYAGFVLVLALFAPIYVVLFTTRMLQPAAEGLYSGGSSWYDMALHASITSSFVYGENFPPIASAFPPEPLLYPFLPDFLTAVLMRLGMDLNTALVATAVPLALAITGIFYWFAYRLAKTYLPATSNVVGQAAAALATLLFLFNGGLGFLYFFSDWRSSGRALADFWSQATMTYANMGDRGIHWTNILVDTLLPQRASLFGIPIALMVFMLFVFVWEARAGREDERRWEGSNLLLMAGALTGMLPLFHPHSYMAVGLVSGFLFLLRPRRVWFAFWLPAVLLAAPTLIGLSSHVSSAGILRFEPGWRGHNQTFWPLYWFRNIGLPTLLIFPAWFVAPARWRRFYLAFVLLLIFSLIVIVSPNDYDNIKLMFYWYAITCVFVAAWLVKLAAVYRQRVLALILALVSIASGVLSVHSEYLSRKLFLSGEEVTAAAFVRENSAPHALFLTAPNLHQPIWALAGRPILRGEYLWHHGYPYQEREADVKSIYAGSPDALELLRYYRVEYIYLGAAERDDLKADRAFFDHRFPVFYRSPNITIYDARASTGALASDNPNGRTLTAYPPREFASRVEKDPYQLLVEFPRASYAVYCLYRVSHGRMPRYLELIGDLKQVGAGVYVSAPGWQKTLEDNKTKVTDEWVNRADFKAFYDSKSNEQFVDALYANAGVSPAASERSALIAALNGGTETRARVLRRVAENPELYKNDYNRAFVLVHYFGYLRRNPDDPPDNNLTGFNFWLNELNQTGDYRSFSRVFIESGEYKDRKR